MLIGGEFPFAAVGLTDNKLPLQRKILNQNAKFPVLNAIINSGTRHFKLTIPAVQIFHGVPSNAEYVAYVPGIALQADDKTTLGVQWVS